MHNICCVTIVAYWTHEERMASMPPKSQNNQRHDITYCLRHYKRNRIRDSQCQEHAASLQCSTRPIFTCYENMDELKAGFLEYAYGYYEQYVANYADSVKDTPYLLLPLSYIDFAREETHLFKLCS